MDTTTGYADQESKKACRMVQKQAGSGGEDGTSIQAKWSFFGDHVPSTLASRGNLWNCYHRIKGRNFQSMLRSAAYNGTDCTSLQT